MSQPYSVIFDSYTKKHYLKDVKKKYSAEVKKTMEEAVEGIARNPQEAIKRRVIQKITKKESVTIGKFDIAIPKHNISGRSGWRGIVSIDSEKTMSRVLLIYSKDHVKGGHETAWWKSEVKNVYPKLGNLL